MDPPLVNDASFTAGSNPSSYSLAELLSFPMGLKMAGGRIDEESTVTEHSGGNGGGKRKRDYLKSSSDFDSSKLVSTSTATNHNLNESKGNRNKGLGSRDENDGSKTEAETNSGTSIKPVEKKSKPEPPKDYIHVRARRGQATDSHSLAERARREKISERMKILQELVPGCNKVIGKALVLDEIINYIQSLQRQVEFLSMKLEAVTSRLNPTIEGYPPKNLVAPTFDVNGMIYGPQAQREYSEGTQTEWLHMQVGSTFERAA
ncbi:hypothetical protein RD792_017850 [Penstemon davidsonii]|uniref:BHLH domain-containing protein n=1 Tax=Penstemon davidsonii TaxID=160366 RepID=A0ABR0DVL6_9LAMI|nr:hypothetical protein RD792_017850 [Penstemon davidsonii]